MAISSDYRTSGTINDQESLTTKVPSGYSLSECTALVSPRVIGVQQSDKEWIILLHHLLVGVLLLVNIVGKMTVHCMLVPATTC